MLLPSDMLGGSWAPRPQKGAQGAGRRGGTAAAGTLGLAEPGWGSAGAALGWAVTASGPSQWSLQPDAAAPPPVTVTSSSLGLQRS